MKNPQRYLLAKYIPDVRRMEPHNIGVILWTKHDIVARFLEPGQAKFVADPSNYQRWLNFWNKEIRREELRTRSGEVLLRKSPQFLDGLLESQRGNYMLYDAGEVRSHLKKSDLEPMLAKLFLDLVAPANRKPELAEDDGEVKLPSITQSCKEIFADAGLLDDPKFEKRNSILKCNVGRAVREFQINYRFGEADSPQAIFQRVEITDSKSLDAASFMFEKLLEQEKIKGKSRIASLYDSSKGVSVTGALPQLSEFSTPVDVSNREAAKHDIEKVAFCV